MAQACTVYGLVDPETEEIRYIGQTTKPVQIRLNEHINKHKIYNNLHLKNWISKILRIGLKPKVIIIQKNAIWSQDEIKHIKKFRDLGKNLLNATDGGDGMLGFKHSEETKKIMSKTKMGFKHSNITKEKISRTKKGRQPSKETKNKIRQALLGSFISEVTKGKISKANSKKVLCVETGLIYISAKEAQEKTGIWNISHCCRGLYKSAGKMHWRYV